MTRHTQHLTSVAAIAVAALALSACNSTGDPGSNTTSAAATTTTSAPATTDASPTTTTPTPTKSPEDEAIEAAEKKIPEYFAVADKSLQDPENFKLADFKAVAISSGLVELENRYNVISGQKFKQTGSTVVESMTNPRVDLKLDLKKSPPDVPTVQLDVCIDVSKVNLVDKDGKSQIPATRKPRQLWRVGVSNYEYPKADAWRVAFTDTQGGKTC